LCILPISLVPTLNFIAIQLRKKAPLLAGEGWVGEGNKKRKNVFKIPLILTFSLKGEGSKSLNLMAGP